MATYPDITEILADKAAQRKRLAALSWEEKVAIVVRMRNALPKGVWGNRTVEADSSTVKNARMTQK